MFLQYVQRQAEETSEAREKREQQASVKRIKARAHDLHKKIVREDALLKDPESVRKLAR